ncbi:hypothetical protein EIN_302430 [Entamoeba invadens IP1]|uniref:Uncharacterized protein n=1 Tax=Entamoeba invadens IP1 TaxID=370355 RepID=A0A0A1UCG5_ENTIV|nr:hypothetical protein EIN_302430 [Entamoeba invadens IP1]ELP89974.1 hypothetical protein EIN_302430 [Entamoeba invadens IP1]|eukprot:XP_004256745.1 hypothetical protein EIN_302430 [Entamoeba invadens IP1]
MTSVLEFVFLKNVVLYLETINDVIKFLMINKKLRSVVESMYINTYNLSSSTTIEKILKIFPNLDTLYINSIMSPICTLSDTSIPLIEANKSMSSSSLVESMNSNWFPSKVRKIHVSWKEIEALGINASCFTQLKSVFIDFTFNEDYSSYLPKIYNIKSLEKVIVLFPESIKRDVANYDFSTRRDVDFIFVMFYDECSLVRTSVESGITHHVPLHLLPDNVKVYSQFLSQDVLDYAYHFIPKFSKKVGEFQNIICVSPNLSEHNELIEKTMKTCYVDCVQFVGIDISSYEKYTKTNKEDPFLKFNYIDIKTIRGIWIKYVSLGKITLPQNLKILTLQNVNGISLENEINTEEIYIENYSGKPLKVNYKNLKKFLCMNSMRYISFFDNNQKLTNFRFDWDVCDYFLVKNKGNSFKIEIEKENKVISQIKTSSFELVNGCLTLNECDGFTLTKISLNELKMNGKGLCETIELGDIKTVLIEDTNVNNLIMGTSNDVTLVNCNVKVFKIVAASLLTQRNTRIQRIDVVETIGDTIIENDNTFIDTTNEKNFLETNKDKQKEANCFIQ